MGGTKQCQIGSRVDSVVCLCITIETETDIGLRTKISSRRKKRWNGKRSLRDHLMQLNASCIATWENQGRVLSGITKSELESGEGFCLL